ncbi:ribonuclease D [Rhodothalassium salexigens DSM 2132]|uniref:Ribonuclease D n=1 Tax=Rhodothalassium salexigens DSM 2132 TaxID=1188247 RepID=A0A4R2PQX1_RHOSA|nr:ribonuclease D [Rhodothalassium salexigens]MBB4210068.1 ribonuclease D [Rhodothalassium salexigens DSM 2132]MBK1639570.1 ribonuclease D [Rhodothalassium salexigens DSM 2132]TCP38233.1 ribonuclease D [Rhodothalassium salexigens DSM 2132]
MTRANSTLITDTDSLVALCDRLSEAEFLTVDTEFMRESTYWPKLCLIQVADETEAQAIDPLAEGLDLTPFWSLMVKGRPLKVFHACRQDLEIVYQATGTLPNKLFDTQLAAMVCGYGDQVGYESLVNQLARHSLDKSARFTDWARRPLTERQVSYALGDVTHLRVIYHRLAEELGRNGRASWLSEEVDALLDPATYRVEPEDAWRRIKTRTTAPRFLGMLREAAAWREREAQRADQPRNRIAKDEVLLELAAEPPASQEALASVRGLGRKLAGNRSGRELMDALERGRQTPEDDLPRVEKKRRIADKTPPIADMLKLFLKIRAQESGVAARLIASAADVEAIARDDEADVPALKGWRRRIYGDEALKMKHGRLALAGTGKGEVEVVELE